MSFLKSSSNLVAVVVAVVDDVAVVAVVAIVVGVVVLFLLVDSWPQDQALKLNGLMTDHTTSNKWWHF